MEEMMDMMMIEDDDGYDEDCDGYDVDNGTG